MFNAADQTGSGSDGFRPTALMQKVSRYVEDCNGDRPSRSGIEREVSGKREYVRLAIYVLLAEGYLALLNRSHLREVGYQRRAVDAIFGACPVVALPGYSRPLVRVSDYLELIREHTFNGRDRVR